MKEYCNRVYFNETIRKCVTRIEKQILKYVKNFYNPIDILLKVWYLIHGTDEMKGD